MTVMVLISLTAAGCGLISSNANGKLTATFTLADSAGHPSTTFYSGDHFDMSFSLINTTADTLTYHRGSTAPPVIFEILRSDSVVATSIDGYAFVQVVLGGFVAPGDSLIGDWEAPNTPAQSPRVVLSPGSYQAKVLYPAFEQTETNSVSTINFAIVP
jgi:hypothetical protein